MSKELKKCTSCGQDRELSDFQNLKGNKYLKTCGSVCRKKGRKSRNKHKDKINEKNREYKAKNKDRIREYQKAYRNNENWEEKQQKLGFVKKITPNSNKKEHKTADGEELKHCGHCDKWLSLDKFSKSNQTKDKLRGYCKTFDKEEREKKADHLDKSVDCTKCDEKIKRRSLYDHMKNKHSEVTYQWKCDICKITFKHEKGLKKHEKTVKKHINRIKIKKCIEEDGDKITALISKIRCTADPVDGKIKCELCNKTTDYSNYGYRHLKACAINFLVGIYPGDSNWERITSKFLMDNKIEFDAQQKYPGLFKKDQLPYDFYLPDYNMLIEVNGKQHYSAKDCFGKTDEDKEAKFKSIQETDRLKKQYAEENDINLIIIDCREYNTRLKINEYLKNNLNIVTEEISDNSDLMLDKIIDESGGSIEHIVQKYHKQKPKAKITLKKRLTILNKELKEKPKLTFKKRNIIKSQVNSTLRTPYLFPELVVNMIDWYIWNNKKKMIIKDLKKVQPEVIELDELIFWIADDAYHKRYDGTKILDEERCGYYHSFTDNEISYFNKRLGLIEDEDFHYLSGYFNRNTDIEEPYYLTCGSCMIWSLDSGERNRGYVEIGTDNGYGVTFEFDLTVDMGDYEFRAEFYKRNERENIPSGNSFFNIDNFSFQ